MTKPRIAVAGAGSIGCYVGGLLALAGHDVRFLARSRVIAACADDGLRLTDFDGHDVRLPAPRMVDAPADAFDDAEVVLVCVKSGDTAAMATEIARHAPSAQVISLQNGVENAGILRAALPAADVRAAMVPFNVMAEGPAHYHRATSGDILVEAGPLPDFSTRTLNWCPVEDIEAVQWGKLLINLGNAINALSDRPLLTQLQDRSWRRLMADQMAEALRILAVAGIAPAKTTAAPPRLIPHILRLPTPIFRRIAAQMLTIDVHARSSMWEDLKRGRHTEIDALQGAIIALADRHGKQAPLNARMCSLIRQAEAAGTGPPGLTPQQIRG
ncbi:2-dehydropantoate 2-reductase [Tateyamaria sp. ANG-S1]|uniref:2-dehydropantoate 2-reductase n=1 Tax=Tateyamaria sp. ANG-S1 TaxID=1577905 RepID=UPI00057E06DD|nr:2-dehydropantoate 2-reductase [Tateyamaria sp. ANG-S1]KIC51213.1 2-dehydropantoate 2-reductase [Tateyamaria sp. ANG-S1]